MEELLINFKKKKPLSVKRVIFFVGLLFAFANISYAQQTEKVYLKTDEVAKPTTLKKSISFGDKIAIGLEENEEANHYNWQILNNQNKIIAQGNGIDLQNFVFEKPGSYTIAIQEINASSVKPHDCSRKMLPETILVEVAPVQMQFLFNEMVFSTPLVGDIDIAGTLTIPVNVTTYNNKSYTYSNTTFRAAGIGATLSGEMNKANTVVNTGKHYFAYTLTGKLKKGTYIMLDFFDAVGNIQSHSFTTPIQ